MPDIQDRAGVTSSDLLAPVCDPAGASSVCVTYPDGTDRGDSVAVQTTYDYELITLLSKFCFQDTTGDGSFDLVRVEVERASSTFMGQAFGVPNPDIGARAAAAKVRVFGACLMPGAIDAVIEDDSAFITHFGILGDPANPDTLFTFQLGSGGDFAGEDGSPGNFGALGVYGANNRAYTDTIINECGNRGKGACDSESVTVGEGETLPCSPQTGELGATTNKALNDRDFRYYGVGPRTECDAGSAAEAEALTLTDCGLSRAVPIAVIKDFPSSGSSESTQIYAVDNFYIAGWDRNAPWGKPDGMVWGYLLQNELVASPAWQFDFSNQSNNPFAPVIVAIVE